MNLSRITDNKNFWRGVKLNLWNKIVGTNSVILRDGREISGTEKIIETFNNFFVNIGNIKINDL